MAIYGVFTYTQMKFKNYTQLNEEILTSSNQLKDSIRPYIESYAPDEYLHLVANELKHKHILAIVIEDYSMGKILGQKAFTSGKIRDGKWNIIDFEFQDGMHRGLLQKATFKRSMEIQSKLTDESIGMVTVYGTDKFLNEELRILVIESILVTILIYILLIGGIYYGINLFLLDPIQKLVADIKKTDKDGIPLNKFIESGSQEVVDLSSTMNNMIDTVKDSRKKLQEQKEEFEMIFNSSQDGIAIVDLDTKFLQFNNAYMEMTGYSKEELLQYSCHDLTVPEEREYVKLKLQETIEKGHLENFEKRCILKDEKVITVNISMSILPDKERILLMVKDVTELKIVESQAKLASMGEMIGNIAHQWRQPLSVISTSASGAKMQKQLGVLQDEEFEKLMDIIIDQSKYLSETIDDFKNFIKEGSKNAKKLNIVALLEKTLTLAESSFKNNYIELVTNFDFDMEILGHENELIQALINIFNNAKDAIKENTEPTDTKVIFLETKEVTKGIEITIKDNGGGIPKGIIERVFEPYFTTKHQSVGTGIGLSLARSILTDHHHCEIDLYNEEYQYKNETLTGACFKITFIKNTDKQTI